jgi:uncharacterized protein (UPF0333 family)
MKNLALLLGLVAIVGVFAYVSMQAPEATENLKMAHHVRAYHEYLADLADYVNEK